MWGCASVGDLGMNEAFRQPLQIEPVVQADPASTARQPASLQQPEIALDAAKAARPDIAFTRLGTEQFVGRSTSDGAQGEKVADGAFTLNFQAADLLEVIKVFLTDLLQVSYVIDPQVQGVASLQTSRALTRDQLLPTLEMLLRMNGAALLVDGHTYRVVPLAKAQRGSLSPQLGDSKALCPPDSASELCR